MSEPDEEQARRAMKEAVRIYGRLATRPPASQGAVLADLVAMFLVQFPAGLRAGILEAHVETVIRMLPIRDPALHEDEPSDAKQKLN